MAREIFDVTTLQIHIIISPTCAVKYLKFWKIYNSSTGPKIMPNTTQTLAYIKMKIIEFYS